VLTTTSLASYMNCMNNMSCLFAVSYILVKSMSKGTPRVGIYVSNIQLAFNNLSACFLLTWETESWGVFGRFRVCSVP